MKKSGNKLGNMLSTLISMWHTPQPGKFLTLKEIGFFAGYTFGISSLCHLIIVGVTILWIPYFYQIEQFHIFIILVVSALVNAIIQPFIATLMEKTNTKIGRYKPFILVSMPVLAILALMALWVPQFESETSRIIYVYFTCFPALIVSGFCNNMYQTMPAVITPNAQERVDMLSPVAMIFGLAPTLINIIFGALRSHFRDLEREYLAMRIMGAVFVVVGVIMTLFILKVKERVYKEEVVNTVIDKKDRLSFVDSFKLIFKNKPLLILGLALTLGSFRAISTLYFPLAIQLRFSEDMAVSLGISGFILLVVGTSAMIAAVLNPILTRKFSSNKIIIGFSIMLVISNFTMGFVGHANIDIGLESTLLLTMFHYIIGVNPIFLLIPIMMGEVCDFQQHKTGKRLEGQAQNLVFVIPGLILQIVLALTLFLQAHVGFDAMNYNSPDGTPLIITPALQLAATTWFDYAAIISGVSGLLMIIVMAFYPLSKKKHKQILLELASRSVLQVDQNVSIDSDNNSSDDESTVDLLEDAVDSSADLCEGAVDLAEEIFSDIDESGKYQDSEVNEDKE